MTQVNTCLKRVFTIFNIIFAIIGALIIGLAVLCHLTVAHHEEFEFHHELLMLYIVGFLTLVLGVLGAYGAHKERLVPLIIFLVCMVTGSLLMLEAAISNAPDRSQLKTLLERRFQSSLPLDQASYKEQNEIKLVQSEYQCCGVLSYTDWSDDIPDSCLCSAEEQEEQGLCKTVTYKRFFRKSIYAEPCFPIILHYTHLLFDVAIGVVFALLVLALLGTILSSIIIHQMRYPTPRPETAESPPPAYTSVAPVFFTTALPKYQELHNPPSC